jgi:two-component system LytT family response regulator
VKILIADDEPLVRETLRRHLATLDGDLTIVEAASGDAALAAVLEERPDVAFLDIRMPGLDGFEVIEELAADRVPVTIFVTAYDEFALRAFDVAAIDYLLKPFELQRVARAWERALAMLEGQAGGERLRSTIRRLRASTSDDRLPLRVGSRTVLTPVREVDYIRSEGNYVQVVADGRAILLRETMRDLTERLEPHGFVRIHRTALVNFDRVRELRASGPETWLAVLADGTRLPVSVAGKRRIEKRSL